MNNGSLVFNHGDSVTFNQSINGSGGLTQTGSGMLTLTRLNPYTGPTTIDGGTLQIAGGGGLSATSYEYVGVSGTGAVTQSGGINNISSSLVLGSHLGSSGSYNLGGYGQLSAASEFVGCNLGATGFFQQTGGVNAASFISIGNNGRYVLSGGTLDVAANGGFANSGAVDFTNSTATLAAGGSCIVDLSQANLTNVAAMSVTIGANSLLVIPAGFDPSTEFAHYSSLGLTHTFGTTLTVPAGQGFGGSGSISDPVNCQGTITGGTINLNGGLTLSGSGTIQLGSGNLTTNDLLSSISGGTLSVANHYVGNGGTGVFTQSGGVNTIGNNLYLGNNAGDSGTYSLGGSGQLSAASEYVGNSGTGVFTQSGGINSIPFSGALVIGAGTGGSGSYNLGGSGQLYAFNEGVGNSGTGVFTQSGGTNTSGFLDLGAGASGNGTYTLGGNGQLSPDYAYVGDSGLGTFTQSGGTNAVFKQLFLGLQAGSSGSYNLSGNGLLSAPVEFVGWSGTATFTQSGGTNLIGAGGLSLGCNVGGSGTYNLSGSGQLSASQELVGAAGPATFTQTGGANTVSLLSIGSSGAYLLAGGVLQVGSLLNQGTFAGGSTPAALSASGIVDLSSAQNLGNLSVTMGTNSLLIVPSGFDPSTGFASYQALGLTHTAGTTLVVPAGQEFDGSGSIADPVNCQGTILAASGGTINLNGGLMLSGSGAINLGSGNLTVNDSGSGISGGSLAVASHYVGIGGTGIFTQSGGTNNISRNLYLGYNAGDSGTYILGGNAQLSASNEYVGYSGMGTFTQSGGINNFGYGNGANQFLCLGYNAGSNGTYQLSGSGILTTYVSANETVGFSGTGTFTQSGGYNSSNFFSLGYNSGGNGTYNLSGSGQLQANYETLGNLGTATFTQSGGTNNIHYNFYLGGDAGSSGAYNFSSGLLAVFYGGIEYVGYSGSATFTQSGGVNSPYSLQVGSGTGGCGVYSLTGSGQIVANSEGVGGAGTGTFSQSGGTNSVHGSFGVGSGTGGSGAYFLSGSGLLAAEPESVGGAGSGTFTQSGGTNTSYNSSGLYLYLGYNPGDSGTYNLSGSGLLSASTEYLGYAGKGFFTQSGGTNTINSFLYLGYNAGGSGTYNLSGSGRLSVAISVAVGDYGSVLYAIGRNQYYRSSTTLGQQREAASTTSVGAPRCRHPTRHGGSAYGNIHAVRRDQQTLIISLSRLQCWRQRHVLPQRQRQIGRKQ